MLKKISCIGKSLSVKEMRNIGGGRQFGDTPWDPSDDDLCTNVDTDISFDPRCDRDRDGRECRYPFYVNSFGRCTL